MKTIWERKENISLHSPLNDPYKASRFASQMFSSAKILNSCNMSFISIKMQQTSIMRNTVKRATISASEPAISVFCHQWKEYFTTWDILTLNSCFLLHSIQWQFYIEYKAGLIFGELQWMGEWRFKFVNHINLSGSVKFLQRAGWCRVKRPL